MKIISTKCFLLIYFLHFGKVISLHKNTKLTSEQEDLNHNSQHNHDSYYYYYYYYANDQDGLDAQVQDSSGATNNPTGRP